MQSENNDDDDCYRRAGTLLGELSKYMRCTNSNLRS